MARLLLPRLLLDAGLADVATLGLATSIAAEADVSVVHALCRWRLVAAGALCEAFATALRQRPFDLDDDTEPAPATALKRKQCARLRVVPVWLNDDVLGLGMTDPTDDDAVEQVVRATGLSVERLLVDDDALERAIRRAFADETLQTSAPPKPKAPTPVKKPAPPVPWAPPPLSSSSSSTSSSSSSPSPVSTPRPPEHAPPAIVTTVGPLPRRDPQLDIVLGEPSSIDVLGVAEDVGSMLFMDAVEDGGFAPISPLASYPPTRTPTATPTTAAPGRAPPGARAFVAEDATREVDLRDTAALLHDVTHDTQRPLQVVQAVASDDQTIPDDSLLFLMRVLIVAEGINADALGTRLRARIKQLAVVPMAQAVAMMEQRRFDEIVVVDPPNTVAGSQVLATIAARAKNGAVIFTETADFARLPGVRSSFSLPRTIPEVCERVAEVLLKRAHGE